MINLDETGTFVEHENAVLTELGTYRMAVSSPARLVDIISQQ
jgi:hypothetical protein